MKLNLSAGSLYTLPLPVVAQLAAEVGFSALEVIVTHAFDYNGGEQILEEVQQILPVASLHAPFHAINGWGDQILQLQKTVDLAIACDIPLVNFHPPLRLTLERKFWRWLNRIEDFQQQVGRGRVALTIENMPTDGPFGCNRYFLHQTEALLQFAGRRNLFLTFDTAHMGTGKRNFLTDFHYCCDSGLIRNIHFSDYGYGKEHLLPGHGVLPLTRFLNHLRKAGYDDILTLELLPRELPGEIDQIRISLKQIFNYLSEETCSENRRQILHAI